MKHYQSGTFTYAPPRAPEPSAIARNSLCAKETAPGATSVENETVIG